MKRTLSTLFFLALAMMATAQSTLTRGESNKTKDHNTCVYNQKFTATERSGFYPFNVADTIQLVSFRYHKNNYPITIGVLLQTDSLIEIKTLAQAAIDSLTDVLYNNLSKKQHRYRKNKVYIGSITQCFFPRNAIVFLDSKGLVKEYILLCFHCGNFQTSSREVFTGDKCTQKMEKLRAYLVSIGVVFGTNLAIMSYPGEDD